MGDARRNALVIGAGIIGLTTALKLQETGQYNVAILAETFSSDPKTIRYTSHWAGAYHVSHAEDDERLQRIDRETFDIMWAHSAPDHPASHCFHRHQQTVYEATDRMHVRWLEHMPEFRYLSPGELIPAAALGYTFRTVTITPALYLSYLFSRFLADGGTIVRASLQHVSQVLEEGIAPFVHACAAGNDADLRRVDALFVCTGLGSRSLGGVEDDRVYALRGQTVLLRAPWVRFGRTFEGQDGTYTYVMSRKDGDVLVGGTRTPDDWSAVPRPETTTDILSRVFTLVPELVPPHVSSPTVDDLYPLVKDVGCGLRPARRGGVRLEIEWLMSPRSRHQGTRVPVVYNYGHGGHGYISSWGSASIAVDLLERALSKEATKVGIPERNEMNAAQSNFQ